MPEMQEHFPAMSLTVLYHREKSTILTSFQREVWNAKINQKSLFWRKPVLPSLWHAIENRIANLIG